MFETKNKNAMKLERRQTENSKFSSDEWVVFRPIYVCIGDAHEEDGDAEIS